jgi:hypothetical protein
MTRTVVALSTIALLCGLAASLSAGKKPLRRASVEELATLQPIVGLGFVGQGFDLTTMQPGFGQIAANTYVMNQVWTNPQNNVSYLVPDEMFAQTVDFSHLSNSTTAFDGLEDLQIWAQHTTHWHSGIFGIDSHSKTTYSYIQRYYTQDESMAVTDVEIEFLELTAPTFPPLTTADLFQLAVEKLPSACCDNATEWNMYVEFLQSFGTAFMDSATLGGRLRGRSWYAKCLLNVTSKSWVREQSSWSILGLIGGGHGHGSNNYNVNGAFKSCNTQTFDWYGGDATGLEPDQYASWIASTFTAPFPVSFTLQPLSALVQDPTKAALLDTAVAKYLAEAQAQLQAQQAAAKKNDPNIVQKCCQQVS